MLEFFPFSNLEVPVVTQTNANTNKCYITSFSTQYISYVQKEVQKSSKYSKKQKLLVNFFTPILLKTAALLHLDAISWVNHMLISTPLYNNAWNEIDYKELTSLVVRNHEKSAIIYRGVEPNTDAILFEKMKGDGYLPLIGRRVFLFDPKNEQYKKKRSFQMDKKLAERQDQFYWTLLNVTNESEVARVLELYSKLYIDKHSVFNPKYTKEFIQNGVGSFRLRFEVLKDKESGHIYAVQGINESENVLSTSFIGYDLGVSKKIGLYRLMNYELMRQAIEKGKILNMSSGADDFKQKRGGVPSFEYQMIHLENLTPLRKKAWKYIAKVTEEQVRNSYST